MGSTRKLQVYVRNGCKNSGFESAKKLASCKALARPSVHETRLLLLLLGPTRCFRLASDRFGLWLKTLPLAFACAPTLSSLPLAPPSTSCATRMIRALFVALLLACCSVCSATGAISLPVYTHLQCTRAARTARAAHDNCRHREECGRHRARDARKRLHWFAWFGPLRAHAALVCSPTPANRQDTPAGNLATRRRPPRPSRPRNPRSRPSRP